ncbi:MAG TPA: carboxy terminal-processing peptidase [Kiritimatiellia bacterium]|nr:carboxy terminal-processing peptidase [Kiritimatiellia bacterium]HMP35084.1 carboxy terminal-processing peptidase [Kiritimatiellia bacterium]
MKSQQKLLFSSLVLGLTIGWVFSNELPSVATTPTPAPESARMARLLANNLPLMHLNKVEWNDELAARALDHFIESLDFERVFFLASDIDRFKQQAASLDDQVKRGDLAFALEVYAIFRDRVSNRVAYAETLLDQPIDTSVDETYEWKRKDAPWAADEAAWDDLWRQRIKHQYLSRIVTDELSAEQEALESEEDKKRSHSETVNATLDPVEFVRKALRRYQNVIQDNDDTWVYERYLSAFAKAFDPHTDFLSPNNREDFEINMKLSLQGIGAMLSTEDGAAKVERLIPGGPAELDGRLKPGDKIIAVAQGDAEAVDVLHWPLYKTVRLIRGDKGSKVVLTVIPNSDPSGTTITKIDLVRDEVKLEEQAAKGELRSVTTATGETNLVGVITLPDFYADFKGGDNGEARSCTRDVLNILNDLLAQGATGIILDLRNNGGGSLTEAIEMTGLFIESGPVVQVRDRRRVRALYDRDPSVAYGGPLVVLVNRLSASASEILAGALQDYGRAVIVGDSKTHGKGTVQTLTELSSANPQLGSVKVTTASFYRIAGGSTQLRGVIPDIIVPSFMETLDVGEDLLPNALPYSTVPEAEYKPFLDNSDLITLLQRKSSERRSTDPRFQSFNDLLVRAKERQQERSISLKLEERQHLVESEKELRKQIDEVNPQTGKKDDLILLEALNVVQDMILLNREKAVAGEATTPAPAASAL